MADKIDLRVLLAAIDQKDRAFYDNLPEHLKKKFSGYLSLRYASNVKGGSVYEDYYLRATNKFANRKFFKISAKDHPKLQWLVLTTISPGLGNQFHPWLSAPSLAKDKTSNERLKVLMRLYPVAKTADLKVQAQLMTDAEYKRLLDTYDIHDDE